MIMAILQNFPAGTLFIQVELTSFNIEDEIICFIRLSGKRGSVCLI